MEGKSERVIEIGDPFHMVLSKGMTFILGANPLFLDKLSGFLPIPMSVLEIWGCPQKNAIKIYDSFKCFLIFSSKKQILCKWRLFSTISPRSNLNIPHHSSLSAPHWGRRANSCNVRGGGPARRAPP